MKYPYHEFQHSDDDDETYSSVLDLPRYGKPKRKKVGIAKPRSVTHGTLSIRQFYRIDESKLTMEQRSGQSINIDITDF